MLGGRVVMRALVVLVAILGLTLPLFAAAARAGTAQPLDLENLLVPPNDRFGLNRASFGADSQAGYNHALGPEAGAAWNRWPLYWYTVENEKGFDYSVYDRAVIGDVVRGTKVEVVILGTPPGYASVGASQGATPKNLELPVFADGTDNPGPGKKANPDNYWARFIQQTVERYKPNGGLYKEGRLPANMGIRTWEIWNEPDVTYYWSARGPGTEVGDYFRLLKVAYLAARSVDPEATISIGGLGYWGREGFIESLFRMIKDDPQSAANGHYFDVMAWHVYSRAVDLYNRASWSRHLLRDFGFAGKQVWINETNIPVWGDATPKSRDPGTHRGSVEEQAAFILQAHAYAFAAGADKVFTFMLYDDCWQYGEHYGLVRNPPGDYPIEDCAGDGKPREGYLAYKIAAAYLRDMTSSRVVSYGPGGAVDAVTFDLKNGARVTIIANKFGEPVTIDLPVRRPALIIDQGGDVRTVWTANQPTVSLYVPAASANDAEPEEPPYYIVGGRTQVLLELPLPGRSVSFVNGGFEMLPQFAAWWTYGRPPALVNLPSRGGQAAMLRNAPPEQPYSRLEQTIRVPAGATPTLLLSYAVATTQPVDATEGEMSTFEVSIRAAGEGEKVLLRATRPTDWREQRLQLPAAYGGKVVTLSLRVHGERYPMAAYADEIVLWPYRQILPQVYR